MKIKANKTLNNKVEDRTTFFYYAFRNILLIGLPLVLISALILLHSSSHSSAIISDSDTDTFSVSISSSCTIRSSVDSPHTTEVFNGNYVSDLGNTKVNTFCNDNNGYSIYAIGSSGDTDGNTDLISSLNNNNYNIHTGIYDSSSITASSPSTWSMKLTAGIGTGIDSSSGSSITTTPPTIRNGYDNYSLVPSVYTLVASRDSKTDMSTDTNATGSYFTTTYDIYASSTQQAGTYTGKVKYLMVHPQSNNQYFSFNEVFAANGKGAINVDGNSYYAMQDMTSDICSKVGLLNEASQTQLVDIRDNKLYWVAKLDDGHCWMTQNLDLEIGGANTQALTSENTDLSTTASGSGIYSTSYGYSENNGVWTWTPIRNTINFGGSTFSGWQNDTSTPYSANKTDDASTGHTSLGNWYNWTAAIASNNSSSLTSSTLNNINNNPQNSICPKGWRLPTIFNQSETIAGSTNEFARLNYLYNNGQTSGENVDTNLLAEPLWFVRSGYAYSSGILSYGDVGSYWSSTVYNINGSYVISFENDKVNPTDYNDQSSFSRRLGWSVRCVAK